MFITDSLTFINLPFTKIVDIETNDILLSDSQTK